MTDAEISSFATADRTTPKAPGLLARLKQGLADWIAELCEEHEADPTLWFSSREWSDLPVHHPRDDR